MGKLIRNLVIVALLVVLVGVSIVNSLAVPMTDVEPPDPAMVIELPDGGSKTLADLVAEAPKREALAPRTFELTVNGEETPSVEQVFTFDGPVTADELIEKVWGPRAEDGDLYALAQVQRARGNVDEALALYLSIPEDHPEYGRAQRRIGWDIYAKELGEPERGVAFVHAALAEDPTDGNCWQDTARVYAHSLGLDFLD